MNAPVPTAGVVCFRGDEVLLIKRGKAPRLGQWSIPGGRIEWGEAAIAAARRELLEETGVEAEILALVDVVDGVFVNDLGKVERHYIMIDYAARWMSGEPVAGDDAADARFVRMGEVDAMVEWPETRRVIHEAWSRFGGA
ncbi:NUDIX hydrolase [Caulobacter sp. NIBR2454]|uniref:NUDIX hydrolase n=1 Tax=Caulobacter sp. NIBR2454 TaxID=3015996 RepID=UPI0022B62BF2|nr:NUDIX hydrolase [Caulobacter sp. NIBR2454]